MRQVSTEMILKPQTLDAFDTSVLYQRSDCNFLNINLFMLKTEL